MIVSPYTPHTYPKNPILGPCVIVSVLNLESQTLTPCESHANGRVIAELVDYSSLYSLSYLSIIQ